MNADLLFEKIDEIISIGYKHTPSQILIEDGDGAMCKEVKLKFHGKLLAFKFDKNVDINKQLFPFFQNQISKSHVMCDYILVFKKEDKVHIIICNLKSKNISNSHDQVHAGFVFANFIVETAARCLNNAHCPKFVTFKAIHFLSKSIKRLPTNPRSSIFKTYENGLKYILASCKNEFLLESVLEK